MPPAQALVTTQPFSDDCHPTLNLSYPILSFSFIFVSGLFLAFRSIIRRRRPIHDNAHLCTAFGLPAFPSNEERRVRKQALFAPTVSTLAAQSAIVASSPLHLNVIPGIEPPSTVGRSMNFLCRGLERSSSWGRATIDLFSLAVSTRVFSLFSSPRQKPIGSNEKEDAGHPQHLSDLTRSTSPESYIRYIRLVTLSSRPRSPCYLSSSFRYRRMMTSSRIRHRLSPWTKICSARMAHFAQLDSRFWLLSTHMTSTTPFALYLLLIFAKDESAPSRGPLRTCLPLLVWPTGPAGSELDKSLTQALEL